MGLGQPRADLAEQVDDPPGRQRAGPAHQVGEAQALEVLHHVVERAVVGVAVVVDLDRVGVRQPGGRLHLALEPGQGDRVGPGLGLDQLQGAGALQELVLGEVDLAHAALAQLADELVLAELAGLVQLGAQAVHEERAVDRQRHADRQEQDVRAGLLGLAELRDDRGDVGMQAEEEQRRRPGR